MPPVPVARMVPLLTMSSPFEEIAAVLAAATVRLPVLVIGL